MQQTTLGLSATVMPSVLADEPVDVHIERLANAVVVVLQRASEEECVQQHKLHQHSTGRPGMPANAFVTHQQQQHMTAAIIFAAICICCYKVYVGVATGSPIASPRSVGAWNNEQC
jgi:hypothetical protein